MKKTLDLEFLRAVAELSGVEVQQARVEKGDSKPQKKGKPQFQNRIRMPSK